MVNIPTRFGPVIGAPMPGMPSQISKYRSLTPSGAYPVAEYSGPEASFDDVMRRQAAARATRSGALPTAFVPTAPMAQMAESVRAKGMMEPPPPAGAPAQGLASAFKQPMTSPTGRAITAAALTGLAAGGYTDRPTTLGQTIAQMGAAGVEAFDAAKAAEATRAAEQQKMLLDYAKLQADLKEKPTALMKNLREIGIDPSSPEGKQIALSILQKKDGFALSVDADGNISFTQGGAGPVSLEKGTKKNLESDILTLTDQISMLDQAKRSYDPELLTRAAALASLAGIEISKIDPDSPMLSPELKEAVTRRIEFLRGVQQSFSRLLNELSGAAVSKFELASAERYSINVNDSPLEFESKLRDQTGFAKAALYRAQQVLGGESITSDLSRKYPISISGKDSNGKMQKLYMHEFVEKYMQNNDVDQATAIEAYAEMAKGSEQ